MQNQDRSAPGSQRERVTTLKHAQSTLRNQRELFSGKEALLNGRRTFLPLQPPLAFFLKKKSEIRSIVKVTAQGHRPTDTLGFNHKMTECFSSHTPLLPHQQCSNIITVDCCYSVFLSLVSFFSF